MHKRVCYAPPLPPAASSAPTPDSASPPQLGTLLYEGPVPPTKGLWYGVEWDDASRGKHSGVFEKTGVRYFETRVEGAGSFLRTDAKDLDVVGKTFKQALFSKYLDVDLLAPSSSAASDEPDVSRDAEKATSQLYATESNFEVEVVLSKKVNDRFKQLSRLHEIGLEWEGVSRAEYSDAEGELAALGQELSRLEVLNLSYSLLPTLQEAERIAAALPRLRHLALNSNRFVRLTSPSLLPGLERLTSLQLNSTLLRWEEVRCLAPSLVNLVDLQLGFNRMRTLHVSDSGGDPVLPKLERLNLESNELTKWPELVEELSSLPSLSELILTANRFTTLDLASQTSAPSFTLRKLRHLSLSDNLLSAWSTSVDALAFSASSAFPSLSSLRLAGNPLFEPPRSLLALPDLSTEDDVSRRDREAERFVLHARLLAIARMPDLLELEGTAVTPAEREDAERFWLEQLAKGAEKEEELSEGARDRVKALRQKHGEATPSAGAKAAQAKPTLKDRLICLQVHLNPSLPIPAAPLELSVLPTLRTLLLRTQISRLIGKPLPKNKFRLVAVLQGGEDGKEVRVEVPPNEEGKELSWWGLQDRDSVAVEPL
ncbi:hypothetical protein JCM10213_006108 [Rhodosporidiobolus nylandii]